MEPKDHEIYTHVINALLANTQAYNRVADMLALVNSSVSQLTALVLRVEGRIDAPAE